MNHQAVLKQAWQILWSYRLLWVLGFILALTTCSWQGATNLGDRYDRGQRTTIHSERSTLIIPGFAATVDLARPEGPQIILPYSAGQSLVITHEDEWSVDFPPQMERDLEEVSQWLSRDLPPEATDIVFGSAAIVAAVIIVIFLLATVARYVAEAALIRAVDERAKTGQKASFGQLLAMGFSRVAWRFFLIDLVIRLPLLLLLLVLGLLSLTPLTLWATGDATAGLLGMTTAGFLITGTMVLAIALNAVLSILFAFFRRACALEELGVLAAIERGLSLIRHNLSDVIIMSIFIVAVSIAWALLLIPVVILLIPVLLACVLFGGLIGLAILLPLAGVASLVMSEVMALVLAGSIALAVFLPIVAAPFLFLNGLLRVYSSSVWTLTYRELRAMERATPEPRAKAALAGG